MREIIQNFFFRVVLLIFGIPVLFVIAFFVFLCSHPTDYAHIKVAYGVRIGIEYETSKMKQKIFERLSPRHGYSDTTRNQTDSVFLIYYPSPDSRIQLTALVRIIQKDKIGTIIKFDSIIEYEFRGDSDRSEIKKIVRSYNSMLFATQFYKNIIQRVLIDSVNNEEIFFDNKQIMNTFKE